MRDDRQFINVMFWILHTGAPWQCLLKTYDKQKIPHRCFCRWQDKGVWKLILAYLIEGAGYGWLMMDGGHMKSHSHTSGVRGDHQEGSVANKRGRNGKILLAMDAQNMPLRMLLTGVPCGLRKGR
jgi:transposase